MMTWVSLRSGRASRGVFVSAQYPQTARATTSRKMMNLFRALYSIIFAIMIALPTPFGFPLRYSCLMSCVLF